MSLFINLSKCQYIDIRTVSDMTSGTGIVIIDVSDDIWLLNCVEEVPTMHIYIC